MRASGQVVRMTNFDATRRCDLGSLSEAWVLRAELLLHDQCWCWGRDVERAEGNLLVEFGFRRIANPEGRAFGYDLERAGEQVVLTGGGLVYAATGSTHAALIGRYDVRPRLLPRCEVDTAQWAQVGASVFHGAGTRDEGSPLSRVLLSGAVRWIAGYETWVREVASVEYRAECLASWSQASITADQMVETWEALLAELQDAEERDPRSDTN